MQRTSAVLLAILVVGGTIGTVAMAAVTPPGTDSGSGIGPDSGTETDTGLQSFRSPAAFEQYVQTAGREYGSNARLGAGGPFVVAETMDGAESTSVSTGVTKQSPRHSKTNVQEIGIGEPDLVKNDGQIAYYSPYGETRYRFSREDRTSGVHLLSLTPPGNVSEIGEIDDTGRLLRQNDTLVVLGDNAVTGYDVANPENPEQVWNRSLDGHVAGARLMDGQVYLVLSSGLDREPCPVEPMAGVSTPCTDVLRPSRVTPADATYTVTRLDATSGEPAGTQTLVGPRNSVVYMSEDSLYLTLTRPTPRGELLTEFLLDEGATMLPDDAIERLERVRGYNLTDRALFYEADHVLDSWLSTMDEDEREATQKQLEARYQNYTREHLREFTTTQIVEFSTDDLAVTANGEVPGAPLNQWALDEHEDTLRIATTVEAPRFRWEAANSSNDVYTLDESLEVQGSVTGMSDGQEVFGVRFVGDTGYVITFRQVDPLHVLDLSDPTAPTEEGMLKLPGFSRYLHPLSEDRLLGIGEEDGQVKTVIFDVSEPTDPTIEESRVLRARWSAAVENHHAFLQDTRHDAFYIPTEFGGQVLSTEDLSTHHRVSVTDPKRAIYVGDYLYVFGQSEVSVIDERNWERTDSLWLNSPQD